MKYIYQCTDMYIRVSGFGATLGTARPRIVGARSAQTDKALPMN